MPDGTLNILSPSSSYQGAGTEFPSGGAVLESPISLQSVQGAPQAYPFPASSGPNRVEMIGGYGPGALMSSISTSGNKRKRSDIEVKTEPPSDLVSRGLLRYDEAVMYFRVFFQGCVSWPSSVSIESKVLRVQCRINTCLFSTQSLIRSSL